ncbi:unnamed protein product [Protopolystoma xenopodis]|uniref:Uncharacterized protein n=1 Tax=Protopolystoma xenopodis TaxID=117903 RepID=A0A448XR89_9PLAT|nr:unnamed protein product [Protopolystoma xenopodis]
MPPTSVPYRQSAREAIKRPSPCRRSHFAGRAGSQLQPNRANMSVSQAPTRRQIRCRWIPIRLLVDSSLAQRTPCVCVCVYVCACVCKVQ